MGRVTISVPAGRDDGDWVTRVAVDLPAAEVVANVRAAVEEIRPLAVDALDSPVIGGGRQNNGI